MRLDGMVSKRLYQEMKSDHRKYKLDANISY